MEWTYVNEKLPDEKTGQVLMAFKEPFFGIYTIEQEVGCYSDGKWFFWMTEREVKGGGVVAWMTLPEPPKLNDENTTNQL